MSDLFENEIKLGVFWPIIAELCLMELPHLKNREKNPATSVFIRMYLGRQGKGLLKTVTLKERPAQLFERCLERLE